MKRVFITTLAVLATVCFFESTAFSQINLNKVGSTIRKAGRDVNKAVNPTYGRGGDNHSYLGGPGGQATSEAARRQQEQQQLKQVQRQAEQIRQQQRQMEASRRQAEEARQQQKRQEQQAASEKLQRDAAAAGEALGKLIRQGIERRQERLAQDRETQYSQQPQYRRQYQNVQYRQGNQQPQRPQYRQTYRRR